jgi:hypothetical protein
LKEEPIHRCPIDHAQKSVAAGAKSLKNDLRQQPGVCSGNAKLGFGNALDVFCLYGGKRKKWQQNSLGGARQALKRAESWL